MKIVATINRWDLVKFNLHVGPRLRANWIAVAVLSAVTFLYLMYTTSSKAGNNGLGVNLAISLSAGFFGILAGMLVCIAFLLVTANEKSGTLGEHEYEIREDGLFERTKANEALARWGGVYSIERSRDQIHVRINSYLFHVIPRHAFKSDDEFKQFFDEMREHWKASLSA